jgi:hypothetical protein
MTYKLFFISHEVICNLSKKSWTNFASIPKIKLNVGNWVIVIGNKEYLGHYADPDRNQLPHAATPTKTMPTESSSFYLPQSAAVCTPWCSRTLNFDTKKNPNLPLSPPYNKRRRQIGVSDRRRTVRAYCSLSLSGPIFLCYFLSSGSLLHCLVLLSKKSVSFS